jgi:H+/Cl- antiporter ClcA
MAQRLRGGRLMLYLTPILALGFFLLKKYYPLLSGNGDMAIDLSILDKGLFLILLIMIIRFIFMILSENANVSGGTVLPLIALGAILGEIIVSIISKNDPSILKYENTFKAIGMFCCLGCAANIPITSYVLAIETLHTYQILLSLGIALIFIVFLKKMINLPFTYKKYYRIELDDRSIV